jgi:putative MATE family efflux protein
VGETKRTKVGHIFERAKRARKHVRHFRDKNEYRIHNIMHRLAQTNLYSLPTTYCTYHNSTRMIASSSPTPLFTRLMYVALVALNCHVAVNAFSTRSAATLASRQLPTRTRASWFVTQLSESVVKSMDGDSVNVEHSIIDSSVSVDTGSRFLSSLPSVSREQLGDPVDRRILSTALPSMLNMAVVPIVNSVDTFWVGRLGVTLALAGQSAANQAFFSLFFLVSFLPTITAPLVAAAVGSGDMEEARNKVCEAMFLANFLGLIGTVMLVGFPQTSLGLVLSQDSAAMAYAVPYLRFRAISMIPALISSTGFASYRGLLNTVTPLKVSLATNLFNLVADPLLIFGLPFGPFRALKGMGVSGAAIATAAAESLSGMVYLRLLIRRKLVSISQVFKVPAWNSIKTIVQGGSAMLLFQLVLNVAFLTAARRVQAMDPTGVSAAAYGIVMQIYSIGVVCHLGIKASAATLVPSERITKGDDAARQMADKIFVWGSILGVFLGIAQMALLPVLIPLFTTIPEVREATRVPALISSLIQFVNGPLFAGEGVMVGLGTFKALTSCTILGAGLMVSCLCSPLGKSLNGVFISLAAFNVIQAAAMVFHHLKMGPLKRSKEKMA